MWIHQWMNVYKNEWKINEWMNKKSDMNFYNMESGTRQYHHGEVGWYKNLCWLCVWVCVYKTGCYKYNNNENNSPWEAGGRGWCVPLWQHSDCRAWHQCWCSAHLGMGGRTKLNTLPPTMSTLHGTVRFFLFLPLLKGVWCLWTAGGYWFL